jgi:hypothetical protein
MTVFQIVPLLNYPGAWALSKCKSEHVALLLKSLDCSATLPGWRPWLPSVVCLLFGLLITFPAFSPNSTSAQPPISVGSNCSGSLTSQGSLTVTKGLLGHRPFSANPRLTALSKSWKLVTLVCLGSLHFFNLSILFLECSPG